MKDLISKALKSKNPTLRLRMIVKALNAKGIPKEEIIQNFYQYMNSLSEQDNEKEIAILGDILDMMTDWYVGQNLDIK